MASQDHQMENGNFSKEVPVEGHENGSTKASNADSSSAGRTGPDDRKLFAAGLSMETTEKELRDYFGHYGEIESINLKSDQHTGRSKGYAFIVFSHVEALDKVLAAGEHTINNKKVDAKKAKKRPGKIFVGGLTSELSDDDIKNYFSQFGNVIEVEMPFDKIKNQRKGFGFITFESDQVVNDLLKRPKQTIKGKEVDVKRPKPKPDQMGPMMMGRGGQDWNQTYGGGFDGYSQGYDYSGYGGYGGQDYSNYGGYGSGHRGGIRGVRGGQRQQRRQPY